MRVKRQRFCAWNAAGGSSFVLRLHTPCLSLLQTALQPIYYAMLCI